MSSLVEDRWTELRQYTAARISLGRTGASLPTREALAFDLAHAQARDAVLIPLDVAELRAELEAVLWDVLTVRSRAAGREAYLARPDWGRRLDPEDARRLADLKINCDVALVVSDGLSSRAVQEHAVPFIKALRPLLTGLSIAPLVIATQARVALSDEIGEALGARIAVSLIGERPGLSSPDSLGIYLTYGPKSGRNDSERNCISNVRPNGLGLDEAAAQLAMLMRAALQAQLSGVALRFDPGQYVEFQRPASLRGAPPQSKSPVTDDGNPGPAA